MFHEPGTRRDWTRLSTTTSTALLLSLTLWVSRPRVVSMFVFHRLGCAPVRTHVRLRPWATKMFHEPGTRRDWRRLSTTTSTILLFSITLWFFSNTQSREHISFSWPGLGPRSYAGSTPALGYLRRHFVRCFWWSGWTQCPTYAQVPTRTVRGERGEIYRETASTYDLYYPSAFYNPSCCVF